MGDLRKFHRREKTEVIAIRLKLDTPGLRYRKWGAEQCGKAGDWLVENGDEVYTVEAESFARTYRRTGPGTYVRSAPVWAEEAREAGQIATKEGVSEYAAGDYIVFNEEDRRDGYAIERARFHELYEADADEE